MDAAGTGSHNDDYHATVSAGAVIGYKDGAAGTGSAGLLAEARADGARAAHLQPPGLVQNATARLLPTDDANLHPGL